MRITRAEFAGSSVRVADRPALRLPEFAFIGRSNVGKSSLINMLTGRNSLANTSSTPGKTQTVNHFLINDNWYLVDLPGYGYAKMPARRKAFMEGAIRDYLNHSDELKCLFVLVDSRHEIGRIDLDFLTELAGSTIPYAIIYTKADKNGPVAVGRIVDACNHKILQQTGACPPYFISSSLKARGREEILDYIQQTLITSNTPL